MVLAILVAAIAAAQSPSYAPEAEFPQLMAGATSCVIGTIAERRTELSEGGGVSHSTVRVAVAQVLKGDSSRESLEFILSGGDLPDGRKILSPGGHQYSFLADGLPVFVCVAPMPGRPQLLTPLRDPAALLVGQTVKVQRHDGNGFATTTGTWSGYVDRLASLEPVQVYGSQGGPILPWQDAVKQLAAFKYE